MSEVAVNQDSVKAIEDRYYRHFRRQDEIAPVIGRLEVPALAMRVGVRPIVA